jgi:hypothetical protein
MRTKFYSLLVTLGLAATATAKADDVEIPAPPVPGVELVIDTRVRPTDLHLSLPKQPGSIWDGGDVTAFGFNEFTGLNLALSSTGIFFGVPHDFLTVQAGYAANTAVAFPSFSR